MRRLGAPVILALLLFLPVPAQAAAGAGEYIGKVNHVMPDGTLRMDYQGGQIRVRPQGMDSAEWPNAEQMLRERLVGRQIRVEGIRWQAGHLIGRVYLDGRDVGRDLLKGD